MLTKIAVAALVCSVVFGGVPIVGDAPMDTACLQWVPYTADTPLSSVSTLATTADTWVIGSEDCTTCDVWGKVLPCFATDYGLDLFGHRDYNFDWIPEDWCRVALPHSDGSGTYFSSSMMLAKQGPKYSTMVWETVQLGDVVPANVVMYQDRVLARTLSAPGGCCAGQGFSGWAQIDSNMTLTSVHIAVYSNQHQLTSFEVAICAAYHPPTPQPTAAPTVPPVPPPPTPQPIPPTPVPIPTLPPTPVPPPPPTPVPTLAPNAPWPVVTRKSCLIGCDYNCTTLLYVNDQCFNELRGTSVNYDCSGGTLSIQKYDSPSCSGTATTTTQPTNDCYQLPNLQYVTNQCETVPAPVNTGLDVNVIQCVEGCDYECTHTSRPAGTCTVEHPLYATGGPTVYNCFEKFIARTTYFATDCNSVTSDTLSITTVHPRNTCEPTNQNDAYITYKCEAGSGSGSASSDSFVSRH